MQVNYYHHQLPFKYAFTTARGTKTHQPTLIVTLTHMGLTGYGEAPAIPYYNVTIEGMIALLVSKKQVIEKYAMQEPERFWHFLHHLYPTNNFLVCALDMAAWDLYGKMRNQPLYKLWGLTMQHNVITDYTIGMDTIDKMVEKLIANTWPMYKVKMGGANDIEMIIVLRQHTSKPILVDANSGWTVQEAVEKIPQLQALGVLYVEEPIERHNYEGMKIVKAASTLPLFADESCVTEKDVALCAESYDGINIKLTKCGGLTPALRMIKNARQLGLKVMVGCMNESTIGTAAMVHLQPLIDYLDADGPLLHAQDLATGLVYDYGKVSLVNEQAPGLGITYTGLPNI